MAVELRTNQEYRGVVPFRTRGTFHAASTASNPQADVSRLKRIRAIAACGGEARQAVTALIVANELLGARVRELQAAVSNGYARGKFEPVPVLRKFGDVPDDLSAL
jgi:hypothetical protein